MTTPCPGDVEATITVEPECPACAEAMPTHYEVRIDDHLVGTCEGCLPSGELVGFKPAAEWFMEVDPSNPDDSHLIGLPGTVLKGKCEP